MSSNNYKIVLEFKKISKRIAVLKWTLSLLN